ncbi:MAG: caspase family protein [Bacteroidia bacterium]|nr:caspase family protein [Bacteroidia bacterium]
MKRSLFALLVGIDKYAAPEIPNLKGCVEDVENLEYFIRGEYDEDFEVNLITLLNEEATRENIIQTWREHFGQAGPADVVFFHYSGHGSREPSAPQFKEFYPDGWDETLVCFDSRPHGLDLADKELAVLLHEVGQHGPHMVISLDSCHSGSGTRSTTPLSLRQISDKTSPRDFDSYLDGYYRQNGVSIPETKHLLMASCNRYETAADSQGGGLYSRGLLQVLEEEGRNVSYADLFLKSRYQVNQKAKEMSHSQHPQFEAYGHFNAYGKFLDGSPVANRQRFPVQYSPEDAAWTFAMGAINGLPSEGVNPIEVLVYPERDAAPGSQSMAARVAWVGSTRSGLDLTFADKSTTLYGEVISLPVPPVAVALNGSREGIQVLKAALNENSRGMQLDFDQPGEARYGLDMQANQILLKDLASGNLIIGASPIDDNSAHYVLEQLSRVLNWERSLQLQNNHPKLNPGDVSFSFFKPDALGNEEWVEGEVVELKFQGEALRGKLKVRNQSPQQVYITLLYYAEDFGIHPLVSSSIDPGTGWMVLWGADPDDYFYLEDGDRHSEERFKLLVTTEQPDSFLLEQEGIEHFGKVLSNPSFRKIGNLRKQEKVKNDWFTRELRVKVER